MSTRWPVALMVTALLVCSLLAQAPKQTVVNGRVIDAAGKPVADVEVAPAWSAGETKDAPLGTMRALQAAKTDRAGKFTLKLPFFGDRSRALVAMNAGREQGGLVIVDPKDAFKPLTIRLAPLVEVKGKFACKELGDKPFWTNVSMSALPGKMSVLSCSSKANAFTFKLPPGKYELHGYGSDVERLTREVVLTADKPRVDLGTIELPLEIIAQHVGKAPPAWHVTDARGVGKGVKLSDFKGKWVVLEFWAFW